MKRVIIFLLFASLLLLPTAFAKDKTDGERLRDLGLMKGVNGQLNEGDELNRAQLAILVLRLNGMEEEASKFTEDQGFIDVPKNEWYYAYINFAKSKDLMNGIGDGKFDPDGVVSEEMVATVLMRALGHSPNWGAARSEMAKMGIKPKVKNGENILRGEVFSYMYGTLKQKIKGKEETLADELKVVLEAEEAPVLIGRIYDRDNHKYNYVDTEGNPVDYQPEEKVYERETNYLKYEEAGYILYDKNDVMLSEQPFPIRKNYYSNDSRERRDILLSPDAYIVIDKDRTILKQGNIVTPEGYELIDGTETYLVFKKSNNPKGEALGIFPEIIHSIDGVELHPYPIGTEEDYLKIDNELSVLLYRPINERYVSVNFVNRSQNGGYPQGGSVYDLEKKQFLAMIDYNQSFELIGLNEFVQKRNWAALVANYYDYRDESVVAEEPRGIGFDENLMQLSWKYGSDYGVPYVYSSEDTEVRTYGLIDKSFKFIAEPIYDHIVDWGLNTYFEVGMDGKYGLLDNKGELVYAIEYDNVKYSHTNQLITLIKGDENIYLDLDLKPADMSKYIEDKDVLTNGYVIKLNRGNYTHGLFDDKGNEVLPMGGPLDYMEKAGVLVRRVGESHEILDLTGNVLPQFDGYASFYEVGAGRIGAYGSDGMGYVLDSDGEIVLGPYDSSIHYFEK